MKPNKFEAALSNETPGLCAETWVRSVLETEDETNELTSVIMSLAGHVTWCGGGGITCTCSWLGISHSLQGMHIKITIPDSKKERCTLNIDYIYSLKQRNQYPFDSCPPIATRAGHRVCDTDDERDSFVTELRKELEFKLFNKKGRPSALLSRIIRMGRSPKKNGEFRVAIISDIDYNDIENIEK